MKRPVANPCPGPADSGVGTTREDSPSLPSPKRSKSEPVLPAGTAVIQSNKRMIIPNDKWANDSSQHIRPVIEHERPSGGQGPSAGHVTSSGGPNWGMRGSQADPSGGKRNKKQKKKNKKKREAMNSDASQEGSTKDTTSHFSGDENVAVHGDNSNDSTSPVRSQSMMSSNSPSTGEASTPIKSKAKQYGQPPTPLLDRQPPTPLLDLAVAPQFGTKNTPVGGDVRLAMEYHGLPTSFGGKGVGRRNVEKPEKPKESRAKSSSSERGVLGLKSAMSPMGASIPAAWNTVQGGNDSGDEESASTEKNGDGGCCKVAPRDPYLRTDMPLPPHEAMYIDSHCHLDFIFEKKRFLAMSVLRAEYPLAFPATFKGCIANFIKPDNWKHTSWITTVVKDSQVLGTSWGVHPHHSGTVTEERLKLLRHIVIQEKERLKIVAIGECGVDLNRNEVPLERQLEIFQHQVDLAYELDLPIIIHCREGGRGDPEDAILNILKERPYHPIHRHCFTRDVAVAEKWMSTLHNVTFGFTPACLAYFPFAAVIRRIPLDRIHLETDAPYFMVPQYLAFKVPSNASLPGAAITVAMRIAEVKKLPLDEVIRATRLNTERIYRLPIQEWSQ